MHDIKLIRSNPEAFDEAMKRRGLEPVANEILELDKETRSATSDLQKLQEEANGYAKKIGELKSKGENADEWIEKSKAVKQQIALFKKNQDENIEGLDNHALTSLLGQLPNVLDDSVPEGKSEEQNQELRQWGSPTKFDFAPKEHDQLGEHLGQMHFDVAAKISGSRFVLLKSQIALLERALANFMLDVHTKEYGFSEVSPPLLVRSDAMFGSNQLPKFAEDAFQTTNDYWLVPTAEVSLVNSVREMILAEESLPLRLTAHTPCFRSEAGAAGKDTKGMIRQHQFWKVELVSITTPDQSQAEHEFITECAESILQKLELPYRTMLLCSGDTGFGAKKTYDIEVWLPGQNTYREISSCSNCGDFQARRMHARYNAGNKDNRFVHTLNGSGLAVGRTLVAVLENYQNADGSVTIPEILRPYMNGLETITVEQ